MLKVMKYDWKNGWNNIHVVLILAVVVSALMGVAARNRIGNLSFVWFAVMMAMLVMTANVIIRNMTSQMFGDKAYLTHTLPVDTWELLLGKAVGTWLFGVFMLFAATACWMLLLVTSGAGAEEMQLNLAVVIDMLPKLGAYFFNREAYSLGFEALGVLSFLGWSFLIVLQFQFVCILSREFGRFRVAGGIIVFLLMDSIEGVWNHSEAMGFVLILICSAACFFASNWFLKHRLSV